MSDSFHMRDSTILQTKPLRMSLNFTIINTMCNPYCKCILIINAFFSLENKAELCKNEFSVNKKSLISSKLPSSLNISNKYKHYNLIKEYITGENYSSNKKNTDILSLFAYYSYNSQVNTQNAIN